MNKLRVAVIGAGAGGLVALRHLTTNLKLFAPVAYELSDRVGGTWVYTDSVGKDENGHPIHSSMYNSLRTNLPKEVMAFPDYPFPKEWPSFLSHEHVLKYLENYTKHFQIDAYISSKTFVDKVRPIKCEGLVKWEISVRPSDSNATNAATTSVFDAVIVCTGHYSYPLIPKLPGLSTFRGNVMHSHDYRQPEGFEDKTVLCLGAASSGQDISIDIAKYAKLVYLAHNKPRITSSLPQNLRQLSGIKEIKPDSVTLDDNCEVEVDTLILCTGYRYHFPFFTKECGIEVHEERITPLYKHVIHTKFPSLSFIGVPKKICPFPQFDCQAQFIRASLDGRMRLPTSKDMEADAEADYQSRLARGMPHRYAHVLGDMQWEYNDELAQLAGFSQIPRVIELLYKHAWDDKKKNILEYRRRNYKITSAGTFQQLGC